MEFLVSSILGLICGGGLAFLIKIRHDKIAKKTSRIEVDKMIQRAKSEASKIEKDSRNRAKDFESRARKNAEMEIQKQKNQLKNKESQLERKLKELDEQFKQKMEDVDKFQTSLKDREEKIKISENRIKDSEKRVLQNIEDLKHKLQHAAAMTQEEARRELMSAMENEAQKSVAKKIEEIEKQGEKEADQRAKRIIAVAISRFASEYTSERTVSVLALPTEEMKGKIIGREGRNIRTLESLCGVDLIVDDTPEAVVISGFDPVRRELARRTLEKLMEDGRIHPARIEEVVEKVKVELNKSIREEGDKICVELGITNLHNEILKSLGSLKYRHSHTQNLLNHSLEVAYLAGNIASEMGLNVKLARRAGLLHDIGKAIDHTVEGHHSLVGAEFCKKYGEGEPICHAIRAHHNNEQPNSLLAHIVQAANVLSNLRPGARRPGMDNYINRLQDLESIGNSFDGVTKTFAVQAGKEVRVIVEASKITDEQSSMLNRDIARKIEREMPHVGQVRIAVIRETRSVEIAR